MRVYVGEWTEDGPRVWIARTTPAESSLSLLRTELAELDAAPTNSDLQLTEAQLELIRTRRAAITSRLEALSTHEPASPLHHRGTGRVDQFGWGARTDAATALAVAVLTVELGEEASGVVGAKFRDDVLSRLGAEERFELPASEVWRWIGANHALIDAELYQNLPSTYPVAGGEPEAVEITSATASELVAACERAWADIQGHHPELPHAVMVLGTGIERGRLVKLGHWWGGRWVADGQSRGEVLLAGEALHLAPSEVFEILLHEAAHGINAARGIKDTSRGGRYHNQRFKAAAEEVLLRVRAMPPYGLARTLLTPEATERYTDTIAGLGHAMRIARLLDPSVQLDGGKDDRKTTEGQLGGERSGERGKSQAVTTACGCGRKMRMAPTVLAAGPVLCGLCGAEFTDGIQRDAARDTPSRREPSARPAEPRAGIQDSLERLHAATGRDAQLPLAPVPLDTRHVAGSIAALEPDPAELSALIEWYRHTGTAEERPMVATDADRAERLEHLARTVLTADGTLRGPTLVDARTGRAFQTGDRVVTADADATTGTPAGTLGTIERVDPAIGSLTVDFATYARLDTSIGETLTALLRHDYAEIGTEPASAVDELGISL